MDHENLDPGAPTRLRLARSHDQRRIFVTESASPSTERAMYNHLA